MLYLVTCNWDNNETYEDYQGGYNEFVGIFDSYDKAKEAIMDLKERSKKIFEANDYYKNKKFEDYYHEKDNSFEWDVPGYGTLTLGYKIEEIKINSIERYLNSDEMWIFKEKES